MKKSKSQVTTVGGSYKNSRIAILTFKLPDFFVSKDTT